MKIDAPVIAPELAGAKPQRSNVYAQQWRKALEQAQWQARQGVAPLESEGANRPSLASAESMSTKPGCNPPADPTTEPLVRNASAANSARTEAMAAQIARVVQTVPTSGEMAILSTGSLSAAPKPDVSTMLAAVRTTDVESLPAAAVRYELPEWPETVLHASVQGSTISVGMRDRSLDNDDALDLYYRLREKLHAAGFELTGFIVNGQNVTGAGAPSL